MSALDRSLFDKRKDSDVRGRKETTKDKSNKKAMGSELQPTLITRVSVVGQGDDTMTPPDQNKKVEDQTMKLKFNVRNSKDCIYCFLVCNIQGCDLHFSGC